MERAKEGGRERAWHLEIAATRYHGNQTKLMIRPICMILYLLYVYLWYSRISRLLLTYFVCGEMVEGLFYNLHRSTYNLLLESKREGERDIYEVHNEGMKLYDKTFEILVNSFIPY